MSAFESDLALANLLAAGREDRVRARAAFEQLARQRPDDLSLLESRALFELRSGRTPEARSYFARAVELDSSDAQTYRQYAVLVRATDPGLAVRLFRRAVALEPADTATRVRLADLIAARDPAGALAVLEPVSGRNPPGAFDLFRLRANAHLALRHLELARDAALDLVRVAVGRQQRTIAASLLASVETSLAAQMSASR
jgi:predicted Zn-dependent protease